MKKKTTKDQEQNRKTRRLSLNRETIRTLDDPALVGLAGGGTLETSVGDSRCCETNESEINQNCYPTTCSFQRTTACGATGA
jgi:hypothetical protein